MRLLRAIAMIVLLFCAQQVRAHDSLPLVIGIDEKAENLFQVTIRLPPASIAAGAPQLSMPTGCRPVELRANSFSSNNLFHCSAPIDGATLSWTYGGPVPASPTLARVHWLTGETHTVLAPPGQTSVTVPRSETATGVARQYIALGIEHIFSGYDHLLFLACLMWIAGNLRRCLLTVTGFTLGHSATLILAALQIIRVPSAPVEAAIALSILLLAREIASRRRDGLIWRQPLIIASLFGLLHGLGFASALRDIGLPHTQLMMGLLSFNLGVEIGQIAAVSVAWAVVTTGRHLLARLRKRYPGFGGWQAAGWASVVSVYAIGGISSYWLIERIASFY